MIFRKKQLEHCSICGKVLQHKHKPMAEWSIDGFLCGDCHLDKMNAFYTEDEKKVDRCELCRKELDPKDGYELHKGLNLKSVICSDCYEAKRKEEEKKLVNCASCGKKLGFFRYNPKEEWKIEGQLCRKCWDHHNQK